MPTSTIKKIISDKGFGFIKGDPKDYFFHRDACNGQFESLREGQSVTYEIEDNPRGPKAVNVAAAEGESQAA